MTAETKANEPAARAGNGGDRHFTIQKIYVKDVSFETPNSPGIFQEQWRPEVQLNLGSQMNPIGTDHYEVIVSVTVTAKVGEKTAFLVEVQQAGIFQAAGFTEAELGPLLRAYCPNILFPYAREAVSDLVTRGGFPQMLLAPVNFEGLYAQYLQQQKAGQTGDAAPAPLQ